MYLQKNIVFYSLPYLTYPYLTLTDNQSKKVTLLYGILRVLSSQTSQV